MFFRSALECRYCSLQRRVMPQQLVNKLSAPLSGIHSSLLLFSTEGLMPQSPVCTFWVCVRVYVCTYVCVCVSQSPVCMCVRAFVRVCACVCVCTSEPRTRTAIQCTFVTGSSAPGPPLSSAAPAPALTAAQPPPWMSPCREQEAAPPVSHRRVECDPPWGGTGCICRSAGLRYTLQSRFRVDIVVVLEPHLSAPAVHLTALCTTGAPPCDRWVPEEGL
jgi:hypothetical protein